MRHSLHAQPSFAGAAPSGGKDGGSSRRIGMALVVATLPVNRIVVARIVERSGIRVMAATPGDAGRLFDEMGPGLVILDGGVGGRECDHLADALADARRASAWRLPRIVFLADQPWREPPAHWRIVDTVIGKPVTVESLQPAIARLVAG
ncbi:response regulator [Aquibium sp. A9E412]|uniref:response regulator n=1 Tax=Aquibium sp. A9E412 TaxID=2976767 RepID=UPI0025AF1E70|nr:response regulator [Aquibium sp. A9E412]MDN2565820.1 response regulator [Aquibium sp. A9E412]